MPYASVALGAMLGANLRFVVANWAAERWGSDFPFGTFIVNVTGALVIGFFLASIADRVGVNPLWRLVFRHGFPGRVHDIQQLCLGGTVTWSGRRMGARRPIRRRHQSCRILWGVARCHTEATTGLSSGGTGSPDMNIVGTGKRVR